MSKNKKYWLIAAAETLVGVAGFSAVFSDPPIWWAGILAAAIVLFLLLLMLWIALRPERAEARSRR
ncbi:hypothetical protein [Amycolatopsis sp. NPDC021455]|uniref:hypothetical protein n=1 Tax=Amycolatopsis sp. NPDC021455 TaxID=3154901 RepID=UPI0033FD4990